MRGACQKCQNPQNFTAKTAEETMSREQQVEEERAQPRTIKLNI